MKTPATRFEDLTGWQKAHPFGLPAVGGLFAGPSRF
jgi:hypothetical protein